MDTEEKRQGTTVREYSRTHLHGEKMVEHLVWFKLKDGVSDERKAALMQALRDLQGEIDGIEHLACGEDFSGRSNGFQIGLVVRFSSREALEKYGPHPAHKAFGDEFRECWDEVMALDFET